MEGLYLKIVRCQRLESVIGLYGSEKGKEGSKCSKTKMRKREKG